MLAKNIIQKPKPKNAVHTNVEGFMNGHKAHKTADNKAAIPQKPINNLLKPCKKVFLLLDSFSFSITSYFV